MVVAAFVFTGRDGDSSSDSFTVSESLVETSSQAQAFQPSPTPKRIVVLPDGSVTETQAPPQTAGPRGVVPAAVTAAAVATLAKIDAGTWPDSANAPGTKGGDTWQNREGRLPRTDSAGKSIAYREWDVNPKIRGETRDAERIITGSDGSAWYTADHYTSFARMR
ncbi:ribonuclease N [Rhodococcus spelaei]|uniref:Ribonuclease N n=1 Tax=Rhodococcus spelaei TaxID=2546320 RepID=A0A541B1B4_9NOCA|nr:ribonuclease N [Rhodococcus spelaei]